MGKTVYNSICSGSNLADYCRGFHVALFCEIQIKKKIAVYQNPGITIPCAEGVFRWNIYLPDYDYSEEELYYALLHECTHFTNGDCAPR